MSVNQMTQIRRISFDQIHVGFVAHHIDESGYDLLTRVANDQSCGVNIPNVLHVNRYEWG
jgi:hypothetical protein